MRDHVDRCLRVAGARMARMVGYAVEIGALRRAEPVVRSAPPLLHERVPAGAVPALKTFTGWRYEMVAPGIYEWTSPHGHRYRRDHHGTTAIDPPDPPGIPRPRRR